MRNRIGFLFFRFIIITQIIEKRNTNYIFAQPKFVYFSFYCDKIELQLGLRSYKVEVKEKIDNLRKKYGWSKSRLAREIGISPTSVYNWYNDRDCTPSRETLEDICSVFNISIAELYTDIETTSLSEKEIQLLELFRNIPEKKKDNALAMLKMLKE